MLKKFEIWSKERFLEEIKGAEENFDAMAETLAALGL